MSSIDTVRGIVSRAMILISNESNQPARQPLVAVVDPQRLRRDALASALALLGLATVSSAKPPLDAALLVLQEDALDPQAVAGTTPYLLIASSRLHAGVHREGRGKAVAVVPAGSTLDSLVSAITAVLAGARPVFARAGAATGTDIAARVRSLSPRERSVLAQLASGRKNLEIGALMGISANTVRTHVQNIFGKLDVDNRGAAVAAVRRAGVRLERDVAG